MWLAFASLNAAIGCYNTQTPPGDYIITLTDDIEIEASDEVQTIDSEGDAGSLTINGNGHTISGDSGDDYQLNIDNPGDGVVTRIENITFTGATEDVIEIVDGVLEVRDSTFTDNEFGVYSGPRGEGKTVDIEIVNSTFTGTGTYAVEIYGDTTVRIENTTFTNTGDTAVFAESSYDNKTVDIEIRNSSFTGNKDAVYADENATNSTIEIEIWNSTFADSSDGALEVKGNTTAHVQNSTFTNNKWAVYAEGYYVDTEVHVEIGNSTIVDNARGIEQLIETQGAAATVKVSSSIVTDNETDCTGIVVDGDNNFDSDDSCGDSFADLSEGSLDVLADNGCVTETPGGCVKTIALLAGSEAIDAGNCNDVPIASNDSGDIEFGLLTVDQRGFNRFGSCDAGAYEFGAQPYTPPSPPALAEAVPYTGSFDVMPDAPAGLYGFGSLGPTAQPDVSVDSVADSSAPVELAFTGSTTVLAQLAFALIGAGALLTPIGRRRNGQTR